MLKISFDNIYTHKLSENHRFPMIKYELILEQLIREGTCTDENFFSPSIISEIDVLKVHTNEYYQIFYRKKGGYIALLSNLGSEFRSDQKGNYYLGISLHLPFSEIGRLYPYYDDSINEFNNLDFNNQYFMDISGRFVTLDFRYFFKEN